MWKYQCKTQFLALIVSFLAGMGLTAFLYFTGTDSFTEELVAPLTALVGDNAWWILCISGGLAFGGIANVIILCQYLMNQLHINSFIIFMLCIFLYRIMYYLGIILYVPMVFVTLYGWVSLRQADGRALRAAKISNDEELVRLYTIHHPLDEKVKPLAEECRKNINKVTWIYSLGVIAIFVVLIMVDNIMLVLLAIVFYMITLNFLLRYRSSLIVPITSLLYKDCNPSACASAIIYFSTRRGKVKLKLQSLFAQCCIYLDDPHLAQDVLITYPRKDSASALTYWSLMSYIDYLLKDKEALYRCKEEASKIRLRFGTTGVMIKNEELAAIDNRINLMNYEFNTCKKYYLEQYNKARLNYEKVDTAYYIALISYVQQDYPVAKVYFEKVVQKGNTMYFKAKAEQYLEKLNTLELEEV